MASVQIMLFAGKGYRERIYKSTQLCKNPSERTCKGPGVAVSGDAWTNVPRPCTCGKDAMLFLSLTVSVERLVLFSLMVWTLGICVTIAVAKAASILSRNSAAGMQTGRGRSERRSKRCLRNF